MLEAPTWRANRDSADRLGYDGDELADVNRRAIALMARSATVRDRGCADGDQRLHRSARRRLRSRPADDAGRGARSITAKQIATFATTAADMVTALTITDVEEAIGIVRAATAWRLPVALSFTVETDGRLPTGQSLAASDRGGRSRDRQRSGLFHAQLRSSRPFRAPFGERRGLDRPASRDPGECVETKPRRARQGNDARRR